MNITRYLLLTFSNGGIAVAEILRETTLAATLKVTIPYIGTNINNKTYYIVGRTFWSLLGNSDYCSRQVITKQSHPELFI